MKRSLGILFSLSVSVIANAQNISTTLEGYFSTSKKDAMYSSVYFDGKGHVLINDNYAGEYFQKDDYVYVFPDKSVFIFKVDKDKLKGVSSWVEKSTYKLIKLPSNDNVERVFKTYKINPTLLYQWYIQNFKEGTDEISFSALEDSSKYKNQMEDLCNKNLTSACGALFGMNILDVVGGLNVLLDTENKNSVELKPDIKIESIARKMINLNDFRGYSLLGSYYMLLGETDKAKLIYEEGVEQGDIDSAYALFGLNLEE